LTLLMLQQETLPSNHMHQKTLCTKPRALMQDAEHAVLVCCIHESASLLSNRC
jgi:hypothetical protein